MSSGADDAAPPRLTEAQWKLVSSVERLIHKLVHDLAPRVGADLRQDLASAGRQGAVLAAARFDPARRVRFTTYAVPYIAGTIRRARDKERRAMKLSRRAAEAGAAFLAAQPEAAEVALDPPELNRERAHALTRALFLAMYEGIVGAEPDPDPEGAAILAQMRDALRAALARLPQEQRDVLRLRFEQDMELRQAGEALGLSERTARRRQEEALDALAVELLRFWPDEEG